ncbi:efflux RND transporter periplasmic adaptor subunit [Flavobacterium sp.]|jgi:RND family efflux transporter MFP subunit|uniref:efflux RND transporter periplasmic adaptor subunit n=1 Tax=Flavobacterium sp. TaxID=239 RepID=UPI0037BEA776
MKISKSIKVMLFSILITACAKENKEKSLNQLASEVIPVKVISLQNSNYNNTINGTGLISTENEAKYAFKIGGVIDRVFVNEGQSFKKGQLLATLKNTEIDAQFSQAQMGYEKAKRDYTRANNLYKDSVATLEQVQNAKTGLDIAQRALDGVAFNKKYASIYANADGFVTKKIANEGEIIADGSPVLEINELTSNNNWIVKLGVTDKEWAVIALGQKTKIAIDAFPNKIFNGVVSRKSLASDQSNGTFQIEVQLNPAKEKLAVGMFAKATIETNSKSSLPIIPYEALIEADGDKAMVFVPVNDKVKRVTVIIESFNKDNVIVKSGLEEYSEIITSNSAFLNENSTIKIIK